MTPADKFRTELAKKGHNNMTHKDSWILRQLNGSPEQRLLMEMILDLQQRLDMIEPLVYDVQQ
jgi:hypothetical protein